MIACKEKMLYCLTAYSFDPKIKKHIDKEYHFFVTLLSDLVQDCDDYDEVCKEIEESEYFSRQVDFVYIAIKEYW